MESRKKDCGNTTTLCFQDRKLVRCQKEGGRTKRTGKTSSLIDPGKRSAPSGAHNNLSKEKAREESEKNRTERVRIKFDRPVSFHNKRGNRLMAKGKGLKERGLELGKGRPLIPQLEKGKVHQQQYFAMS